MSARLLCEYLQYAMAVKKIVNTLQTKPEFEKKYINQKKGDTYKRKYGKYISSLKLSIPQL